MCVSLSIRIRHSVLIGCERMRISVLLLLKLTCPILLLRWLLIATQYQFIVHKLRKRVVTAAPAVVRKDLEEGTVSHSQTILMKLFVTKL